MSNLRIIGLIIGIVGLFLTFRIYRGPKWRRLNFVLFGIFSLSLIAVSINPNLVNIVAGMLALRQEHRGRILTLLIYSNLLLWFLLLYFKTKLDDYRHQFDLFVRNLGYEEVKPVLEKEIKGKEIIVIIPAHNEAKNLRELLKNVPDRIGNKKIGVVVVDDGSIDETTQVAKEAGYLVVRNKIRRGGGAALRLGYDVIKDIKPEIVVTMDADGQHNPQEIERLVNPILQDRYDFVIGSRILGEWEKDNRFRFVGLHIFNFIINLLLRTKVTDCSSGFRAFKVDLLKSVTLKEDQFHTSELIIDAAKKGIRIGEVPITILKRKHGRSKKGRDWKYGLNFAKTILKTWWR
jgi:hypothetical protein